MTDWIRDKIVNGEFKPGDRITQEAVAKACGTSRIPVREALGRLQDEGLVTLTSHVGAAVARLDRAELTEVYLLRERLEPFVLSRSIPRLGASTRRKLHGYVDEMEALADPDDPSAWVETDRLFHLTSYATARLPQFTEIIDGLWNRTQQYRRAYTRLPQSFELAHLEHRLLLNAIDGGDPADAEAILTVHIRRTRSILSQHGALFND